MKIYHSSPLGILEIEEENESLCAISFVEKGSSKAKEVPRFMKNWTKQLDDYFSGDRLSFSIPLHLEGTPFQKSVWSALMEIPFGKTISYKELARKIGNENSVRAVGNANGKNKLPILIPCHRVIQSDGKMGGYSGELWRKEYLLNHEREIMARKAKQ